ncbi:MAG TPA: hypothetical protein VNA24_13295 [Hyalangium sp.]|nr:hypothetical protein [Hyalangium sp.]
MDPLSRLSGRREGASKVSWKWELLVEELVLEEPVAGAGATGGATVVLVVEVETAGAV